ncbi:cellulose biosynthesis protein BcsR [Edaphovirga cremea]|uniref:cellulose biosynthesis protein BcsR n=1 Tax=Edaphovirga cremea TaxID=2267246 RepID=UPI000DEEF0CA|nr:cellulose biosynthesis protein BcsR [Edaphovirga cremea]
MDNSLNGSAEESFKEIQDDVFVLRHTFALPKINYVDIALHEQLPHMMAHWPLLAEFALSIMPADSPASPTEQNNKSN